MLTGPASGRRCIMCSVSLFEGNFWHSWKINSNCLVKGITAGCKLEWSKSEDEEVVLMYNRTPIAYLAFMRFSWLDEITFNWQSINPCKGTCFSVTGKSLSVLSSQWLWDLVSSSIECPKRLPRHSKGKWKNQYGICESLLPPEPGNNLQ